MANSIDGTARTAVLTLTWESTIDTVRAVRTHFRAVGAGPARITMAGAGDVMAITVFAVALLQTSPAIRLGWTSVLAYRPDVTRSAFKLSGHVVA